MSATVDRRVQVQITDSCAYAALNERRQGRWVGSRLETYPLESVVLPRCPEDVTTLARELGRCLREDLPVDQPIGCIIPASWCLIETVTLPSGRWSEQAALYDFEQRIPLDLESLTCLVSPTAAGSALVVGVFTKAMHAFFEKLEEFAILIDTLTVDVIVASRIHADGDEPTGNGFILSDDRHWTAVAISKEHRGIELVHTMPTSESDRTAAIADAERLLSCLTPSVAKPWQVVCYRNEDNQNGPTSPPADKARIASGPSNGHVVNRMLEHAGDLEEHVNLRRGPLAFAGRWSSLRAAAFNCTISLVALLLIVAIRMHISGNAYAEGIAHLQARRAELYERAFPDQPLSPAAALRLRSERIKLDGLTNPQDASAASAHHIGLSVLQRLRDVVDSIPADVKLHVLEAVADDRNLRLVGRTTSHTAAGAIVQQLNKISGVQFEPPATTLRTDGTVDFRINGSSQGNDDTR